MLGLDHLDRDDLSGGEWIVPPFQLLRNAFSKGGPFTRAGKIPPVELDQHAVTYLTGDWQIYRPDLAAFVPDYADASIELGQIRQRLTVRSGG